VVRTVSQLGEIVREVRERRGISRRSLARRAGTSPAAIARVESGPESPSFERFEALLLVMGERPVLRTEPLAHRYDLDDLALERERSAAERLAHSLSWNRMASEFAIAGARARRANEVSGPARDD